MTFSLPAGQRVAKVMEVKPLSPSELADLKPFRFDAHTPLWIYIMREAEVTQDGKMLGQVGGRIVAEVFVGLLESDRMSYLRQDPDWTPTFGQKGDFRMADLLRFAGVA